MTLSIIFDKIYVCIFFKIEISFHKLNWIQIIQILNRIYSWSLQVWNIDHSSLNKKHWMGSLNKKKEQIYADVGWGAILFCNFIIQIQIRIAFSIYALIQMNEINIC